MEDSDEFKTWFDEYYVKDGGDCFIQATDLYQHYVETQHPRMSKKQQREHNTKWLKRELQSNMFVKSDYKERYTFRDDKGKQNEYRCVLMGWQKRPVEFKCQITPYG